ncbi:uncharacterized protein [Coffea arabica]|uniref:ATP-dependent DNA helicase n=1 Tax=Coffea arabica TaxID=13443 RepID=A0ABM4VZE4_COFAR
MREFSAFRIQNRLNEAKKLVSASNLFQQYIVDAFAAIEENNLNWIRANQQKIRAALYKGLQDNVVRGDTTPASAGKQLVLPSTFTGGPRYMVQNYQDAMAIYRFMGPPDLFITFTCNSNWPEISKGISLILDQKVVDRPDIVARVFRIKLDQLINDLTHGQHFGKVIAALYTIEFQKRGLPHAHILLFLHPYDKCTAPRDIDRIISAELPDKNTNPIAYEAVLQFMTHGPCGPANRRSPCMENGKCSKHYLKNFQTETIIEEEGFPVYRRRDNGREGYDRATFVIEENDAIDGQSGTRVVRESIAVRRLNFHLPNEQPVLFGDNDPLDEVLIRAEEQSTTFIEWTKTNSTDTSAQQLTYVDFPTQWTWKKKLRKWVKRKSSPWSYEEIRTVNGVVHPTFKVACQALGLLGGDEERHNAIREAANWQTAVDRTFRDILRFHDLDSEHKVFGGKTMLLGSDFRQILPVVPKGDSVESLEEFSKWILDLGEGKLPAISLDDEEESTWIEIPNDLLIPQDTDCIHCIIDSTYPDLLANYNNASYLLNRAILAPTNDVVDEVNSVILSSIPGHSRIYLSADIICPNSDCGLEQASLYPVEFLNTHKFSGIPNHSIELKVGIPIILLRNMKKSQGLCNGTRLIITNLGDNIIEAETITGSSIRTRFFIHRIDMTPTDSKWPFVMIRRQFPIKLVNFGIRHRFVTMNSSHKLLNQLTVGFDSKKIKVRVTRMWDAINTNTGDVFALEMVLLDEDDNHMVAIVPKKM